MLLSKIATSIAQELHTGHGFAYKTAYRLHVQIEKYQTSSSMLERCTARTRAIALVVIMPFALIASIFEHIVKGVICLSVAILKSGAELLGIIKRSGVGFKYFDLKVQVDRLANVLLHTLTVVEATFVIPVAVFRPRVSINCITNPIHLRIRHQIFGHGVQATVPAR